jgi:hypothetical protein
MARITLDDFVEAFTAQLVAAGQYEVRLDDPRVRDGLFRVYSFLESALRSEEADTDRDWRRSLVNIKNVFQPSAIGSFDRFEALMRAKQVYLTDHPNPYYQDICIKISDAAARRIVGNLPGPVSQLVSGSVTHYLNPPSVTHQQAS